VDESTLIEAHTTLLDSLVSLTDYHYIIVAEDEAGNKATSTEEEFTTL
jgi:hypothetical protein